MTTATATKIVGLPKEFNRLNDLQVVRLYPLIESEYATSGATDDGFAMYASQKLGFKVVSSNVQGARKQLGIGSNIRVAAAAKKAATPVRRTPDALFELLADLERRSTEQQTLLERRINELEARILELRGVRLRVD